MWPNSPTIRLHTQSILLFRRTNLTEAEGRTWYTPEELQESFQRAIDIRAAREEQWNRQGLERMRLLDEGMLAYRGIQRRRGDGYPVGVCRRGGSRYSTSFSTR